MVRYPEEENDNLINIVEIINPVFLINLLYSSVYLKEINKIMISYIEKNSIDIVIKKENLITGKKELDITEFILEELNKKKISF